MPVTFFCTVYITIISNVWKHQGGGGGGGEMNLFEVIFDPIKSLHKSLHKLPSTYQKSLITDASGQGDTLYYMWENFHVEFFIGSKMKDVVHSSPGVTLYTPSSNKVASLMHDV